MNDECCMPHGDHHGHPGCCMPEQEHGYKRRFLTKAEKIEKAAKLRRRTKERT